MRTLTLSLALAALFGAVALADVVTLTDGSKREGRVIREDEEEVVLEVALGSLKAELILKRSEIASIEKGKTANDKLLEEVERRRARLGARDVPGWLSFAEWLDRQDGFSKDALAAYRKVIAIDKDNEIARRRLGYHKVGGQWLSEEEVMIAKGYVKHRGEWMTPEQKAAAEKEDQEKLEKIRIALAEDRRRQEEADLEDDATARRRWLQAMQDLAREQAARYRPNAVTVTSGGVVAGPYGYGYYGVQTPNGQYIPYVPAGQPVYYVTGAGPVYYVTGTSLGCHPYVTTQHHYSTVHTGVQWGLQWSDSHWNVGLGSGGWNIHYSNKK